MNACSVLVLTSMHEASPCVIKEALACNLPIVSVDVGDVAERIDGAEGCYLCERTPQDVAAKLRLALMNGLRPDTRSKIAGLSLRNTSRRVIAVYEEALVVRT
jgi:teichuronic acid biosynthesis glycosyltransferase TuaC